MLEDLALRVSVEDLPDRVAVAREPTEALGLSRSTSR